MTPEAIWDETYKFLGILQLDNTKYGQVNRVGKADNNKPW